MSEFFRSFNRIVGQRQRATVAYRPQANDWDEYAERLTFALNTAQDRIRGDTTIYLLHGWDPRSTLEAMDRREDEIANPIDGDTVSRSNIGWPGSKSTQSCVRIFKNGQIDITKLSDHMRSRLELKCGYRVKEGYARKLTYVWHGPFRLLELADEHAVRLEIAGTEYRLFPVVHGSKIKPVRQFPGHPQMRSRYDFDDALLPEDSRIRDLNNDEYEVEMIVDMRSGRRTRHGRTLREFLVYWKGYDEPTWWMKPIIIVELYYMTICEIERIEIDSRSCNHMRRLGREVSWS
ncbi:LOW QUALITY PROTEIN: Hypothetical protein PHPALM_13327, partial [Phytophthora palmivora]